MPSAARTGLDARLADIQDILDAHAATAGGGRGRKWKVAALNKGSLVLLTAHLEGFLEDLYKEAVGAVVAARVASARVPDRLKLTALRRIAGDIRSAGNPAKRDEHTLCLIRKAARLGHPRTRVSAQDVDTPSVLNTFANPRPDAIDGLFANLGIDDILARIHWRARPRSRSEETLRHSSESGIRSPTATWEQR